MPILFVGIPLFAVVVLNILSWKSRVSALWAVLAVSLVQLGLAGVDIYSCLTGGGPVESSFFGNFTIDLFSASVLAIIGLICTVAFIVAHKTVDSCRFSFGN
ncbi:MAG: hypothetical protein FWF08_07490, partial [Oscillospiraceae bacterium]|nr:hypothetical protein [Oscillospiraceae bacterium]